MRDDRRRIYLPDALCRDGARMKKKWTVLISQMAAVALLTALPFSQY